jgi:hypothetical protein
VSAFKILLGISCLGVLVLDAGKVFGEGTGCLDAHIPVQLKNLLPVAHSFAIVSFEGREVNQSHHHRSTGEGHYPDKDSRLFLQTHIFVLFDPTFVYFFQNFPVLEEQIHGPGPFRKRSTWRIICHSQPVVKILQKLHN